MIRVLCSIWFDYIASLVRRARYRMHTMASGCIVKGYFTCKAHRYHTNKAQRRAADASRVLSMYEITDHETNRD